MEVTGRVWVSSERERHGVGRWVCVTRFVRKGSLSLTHTHTQPTPRPSEVRMSDRKVRTGR